MLDSLGFVEAVSGLPEQLAAARASTAEALAGVALPGAGDLTSIAVLGMGGSGISGDVLAAAASGELCLPVVVHKQIRTPAYIGPRTLVFAVSYSGDTEETVAMTRGAIEAGARVVTVSSGGELARLAADAGALHVPCPPGYMPRAAIGTLIAPILGTLGAIGLLADTDARIDAAVQALARRRDASTRDVAAPANLAREVARRIDGTIPLIYGGGAIGGVAAMRWKCDINENAKAPAFWAAYPELDHNEICGWGQHGDVTRQLISIVELRHDHEHARLVPRIDATRDLIDEAVHQVIPVAAAGEGRLAQLLDLMYLGDWTSVHLAADRGVDPGPIDAIATLKGILGAPEG
ncbi:MAG: bifunctional phosphoglucose/phosphomannose isomerase [Actinomycetes bacterium]